VTVLCMLGANPFRWRQRFREYVLSAPVPQLMGALANQLADDARGDEERAEVCRLAECDVRVAAQVWLRNDAGARFRPLIFVWVSFLAALAVILIGGGSWVLKTTQSSGDVVAFVLTLGLGIAPGGFLMSLRNTTLTRVLISIEVMVLALLTIVTRDGVSPYSWLSLRGVHGGLVAAAWLVGGLLVLEAVVAGVFAFVWTAIYGRQDRGIAKARLVNKLCHVIADDWAEPARRGTMLVGDLDNDVETFVRHWPRSMRTGSWQVDRMVRAWAADVAAAIREEELSILLGHGPDPRPNLARTVAKLIRREKFANVPDDAPIQPEGIAQRVKSIATAIGLALLTVALGLAAVWQPTVPDYVDAWGWPAVADALKALRASVFGLAAAAFMALLKAIVPNAPTRTS
jgi:hypothetical protein